MRHRCGAAAACIRLAACRRPSGQSAQHLPRQQRSGASASHIPRARTDLGICIWGMDLLGLHARQTVRSCARARASHQRVQRHTAPGVCVTDNRTSNGIVRENASAPAIQESVASIVSGARPTHTILLHADGACSRTCVRGRRPNMVGTSREGGASDGGVDAGAQAVAELRRGSAAHRGLRAATAKGGARPRCWAEHTRRGSGDGHREL